MAVKVKYQIVMFVALVFFISSCVEFEEVSPIPSIEYQSIEFLRGFDSLGNPITRMILEFSFIDGDADFGVYDEINGDTTLPDSQRYGMFVLPYEKIKGEYFRIDLSDNPNNPKLNFHIPYDEKLNRVGQNKTVKGFIRVNIDYTIEPPYDTLMYEFYIRDRALNKSNIERTDDFSVELDEPLQPEL